MVCVKIDGGQKTLPTFFPCKELFFLTEWWEVCLTKRVINQRYQENHFYFQARQVPGTARSAPVDPAVIAEIRKIDPDEIHDKYGKQVKKMTEFSNSDQQK